MSVGSGTGTAIQTISYDLATAAGQLRLEIGDTVSGAGVRPDGTNFSDLELAYFLTQEGGVVGRAAARACETLARLWASQVDLRVGPRDEKLSQAAERWAKQALELRAQYGGGGGVLQAGTIDLAFAETADAAEW